MWYLCYSPLCLNRKSGRSLLSGFTNNREVLSLLSELSVCLLGLKVTFMPLMISNSLGVLASIPILEVASSF